MQIQIHTFPPHLERYPPFLLTARLQATLPLLQIYSITELFPALQQKYFNRASVQKKFENSGNAASGIRRNVKIYEKI